MSTIRGNSAFEAARFIESARSPACCLDSAAKEIRDSATYRVEPNEHPAVPRQSAWHGNNPAQEMGTAFAADAVHVTASESDGAAATVVLRLTGYGYSSNQQPPARAVLRADENRITYDR